MSVVSRGINFIQTLAVQRDLIVSLAKREISAQYQGSILGFLWAIINPLVSITLYWFVFSFGFKVQPVAHNVPFVVWLTAGLSIWMFFSEIVLGSSEIVIQNAQLIKKTLFKAQILPVVKVLSSSVMHVIFVSILLLVMMLKHQTFSLYYFQALYYYCCAAVLALGISWLFSSISVFVRDAAKFLNLLMQVIFWITPIFWDINIMSDPRVKKVMFFNPIYYIVEGYRDSFINSIPFWNKPEQTLVFWLIALGLCLFGASVFQRLKPHFADVL